VPDAYTDALRMLARRDLSEAQVRERLARRAHSSTAIDTAVARLLEERAIDDARAASAIARAQVSVKRRGQLRVRQAIERAGIAPETARRAVRDIFESIDPDALLDASLAKRLPRPRRIATDAEFGRLYRYLIRQGFEPDRVVRALTARAARKR
jgi:regulatory protein